MAAKPRFGIRSTALALAAAWLAALTLAARVDAFVYWANDNGTIARANLDGSAVNERFIAGADLPWGVAVDGQHIYWGNQGGGNARGVGRANLDGTRANQNFTCVCNFSGGAPITGVAVNSSFLYFVALVPRDNGGGAQITNSSLANGELIDHFATSHFGVTYGAAIDENFVYWADNGENAIARLDPDWYDDPDPRYDDPFITAHDPTGLAVDSNFIYWANRSAGTIGRANLDGTGVNQSFITGAFRPTGVAVDGNHIYWANQNALGADRGTIGRANLDGGGVDENFIATSRIPAGVAVDGLGATCAGRKATIVGTGRRDTLRGTNGDDVIAAGGGDDTVAAGRGDDLICGGGGDDVIRGGRSADAIRGGRGTDVLRGGRGEDVLRGGAGSDPCRGGPGADRRHGC